MNIYSNHYKRVSHLQEEIELTRSHLRALEERLNELENRFDNETQLLWRAVENKEG